MANRPAGGNYELQTVFLQQLKTEITQALFVTGAVSRITQSVRPSRGAIFGLLGVDQLDSLYSPSLQAVRGAADPQEQVLSLVAGNDNANGTAYAYFNLGMIDATDTFYPYGWFEADDVRAVHQAAQDLLQAKRDGVIPDLSYDLLRIDNPNTAMRHNPR